MDVRLQSLFLVTGKESTDNCPNKFIPKKKLQDVDLLHVKGPK